MWTSRKARAEAQSDKRAAAYNQEDVKDRNSISRMASALGWTGSLALIAISMMPLLMTALAGRVAYAQTGSATAGAASMPSMRPIVLVLPFDNQTDPARTMQVSKPAERNEADGVESHAGGPTVSEASEMVNLDWIREAAAEILNRRLTSVGYLALTREDRQYALDHLGLPENLQPSRATALRVAETLDAGYVVIGSFAAEGTRLHLTARVIDGTRLRMSRELVEDGEIAQLLPLLDGLAWQVARELNPDLDVSRETFVAASRGVRLDAFEQYVRGVTERDPAERERHLKRAVALSPELTEAWMALGREEFEQQEYEDAARSFEHVPAGHPAALESDFYRGLALIYSGGYEQAQTAFAAIARVLPLPEVVNNEAVALSRRGMDGTALYRQASGSDPKDEDYHFNLAVSLHHAGDVAAARRELEQALKLSASDTEARSLLAKWGDAKAEPVPASQPVAGTSPVPAASSTTSPVDAIDGTEALERIKRQYDGAAFRQAAMMLESVEQARIAALPASQQALKLSRDAQTKLNEGLLLEAEREYRQALAADPHCAEAHAGLAEVMERAGEVKGARSEAQASLSEGPNVDAELVLARLDLAAGNASAALADVDAAQRLDGKNRAVHDLRRLIERRMKSGDATQ